MAFEQWRSWAGTTEREQDCGCRCHTDGPHPYRYEKAHGPLSKEEDDENHHPEMTVERIEMGDNDEE